MLVTDKVYKVFTTFFITITVEVKFDFIQMDFWVDVAMTQKKQFFFVTHFQKFLVDFCHMLKLSLRGTMPDILII